MNMQTRYFIGIDPDVNKSGVAVWDAIEKQIFTIHTLAFFELFNFLEQFDKEATIVVVDAGWLNKTNFHAFSKFSSSVNAKIGEKVGANHCVGQKIVEMCEHLGLSYELHRPTQKKLKADEFKRITGWQKRSNQECRDAASCVIGR